SRSTQSRVARAAWPDWPDHPKPWRNARSCGLEPLEPHEIVPFHLLQALTDEPFRSLELRNHAVLERIHATLDLLDLFDQAAHRRLDLRRGDHVLDEVLVGFRRLVDPGTRPYDPVAPLADRLADGLRVDLRHHDPHDILRLEVQRRRLGEGEGGGLHSDGSFDRPCNRDPGLGDPVLLHEIRSNRFGPFEHPEELDNQGVLFELEEPGPALCRPANPPQLEELGPRRLVLNEHHQATTSFAASGALPRCAGW